MTMPREVDRRLLVAGAGTMLLCAAMVVAATFGIRASWPPPGWPFATSVPFVTPHIASAAAWWSVVARWEAVWTIALVVVVVALRAPGVPRRAALAIVALQAVLLAAGLSARIPFNGDQYLYVGLADLVHAGDDPYAPPYREQVTSPQLIAIGTVWGHLHEGGPDNPRRIVLRSRYGPVGVLLDAAVLWPLRNASVEDQARALRILAAIAALACSLLLWQALRDRPWGCAALAAFALNPLVVMETSVGAHNDILALAFALGCFVAASRGRFAAAGVVGILSVATKITFAPFALALLLFAWRARRARGVGELAAGALGAALVVALPFGLRSYVQPIVDASRFNRSYLVDVAQAAAHHLVPSLQSPAPFSAAFLAALAGSAIALAVAVARGDRGTAFPAAATTLLIFSGARFEPWYGMALTPLLLVRTPALLPLYLGASTAAQIFLRRNFIGGYGDMPPLLPFVVLALVVAAVSVRAGRADASLGAAAA